MPSVPESKKCKFFGCRETKIFGTNYCATHGGKRSEKHKTNQKFYNSAAWKQLRKATKSQYPLCAACLLRGQMVETEHIDHFIPHRQNNDRFLVNLFQGLCGPDHTQKTKLEKLGIYRHYTEHGIVDYKDSDYEQLIIKKFHADLQTKK